MRPRSIDMIVRLINWELLREQKSYCINEANNTPESESIYHGIVQLFDSIQDAAVTDGLATNEEVFGVEDTSAHEEAEHLAKLERGYAQDRPYFAAQADGSYEYKECRAKGFVNEGETYYQLQTNDELGVHSMTGDEGAIRDCIVHAAAGDVYAIETLRLCQTDQLVRKIQSES